MPEVVCPNRYPTENLESLKAWFARNYERRFISPSLRGKNANEIGNPGSGVYRSGTRNADGSINQFRMDNNSLEGNHRPNVPHVHFERVNEGVKKPIVNNHVPIEK